MGARGNLPSYFQVPASTQGCGHSCQRPQQVPSPSEKQQSQHPCLSMVPMRHARQGAPQWGQVSLTSKPCLHHAGGTTPCCKGPSKSTTALCPPLWVCTLHDARQRLHTATCPSSTWVLACMKHFRDKSQEQQEC